MMPNDNVFRALNPERRFERSDGSISPAAFKDAKGLSVEIGAGRSDFEVANTIHSYLRGNILKISTSVCEENKIEIYKDKSSSNKYHRLLLNKNRANGDLSLTQDQCYALATAESNVLIKMDKLHNNRPS